MSFQFGHIQTYSRKGNGANRSVGDICDEAARAAGSAPHVKHPQVPRILHGCSPAELPQQIDDELAQAAKDAKGKGRGNAPRKDTHVLEGMVLSYPGTVADIERDPAERAKYEAWLKDAVEWAKKDQERRGVRTGSIVVHTDEKHPHVHVLGIPTRSPSNPRQDAKGTHPGHQAKKEALDKGADPKGAQRAYNDAMRKWQDRLGDELAILHGQTRHGPGKRRLSREAWMQEQAAAKAAGRAIQAHEDAKRQAEEMRGGVNAEAQRAATLVATATAAADAMNKAARSEKVRLKLEVDQLTVQREALASGVARAREDIAKAPQVISAANVRATEITAQAERLAKSRADWQLSFEAGIVAVLDGKIEPGAPRADGVKTLRFLVPEAEKPKLKAAVTLAWADVYDWACRLVARMAEADRQLQAAAEVAAKAERLKTHLPAAEQAAATALSTQIRTIQRPQRER